MPSLGYGGIANTGPTRTFTGKEALYAVASAPMPPQVRIDFYSSSGEKLDTPPLEGVDVISVRYDGAEGEVGAFEFRCPATAPGAASVANERQAWIYYGSEGLVRVGVISTITTENGGQYLSVSGFTRARGALARQPARNRRFEGDSLATVMAVLLGPLAGATYSAGQLATPETAITLPIFGESTWEILRKVRDSFGLLMRENDVDATIDMDVFGDDSGLVFGNVPAFTPGMQDNRYFAAIAEGGLKITANSRDVVNRIVPLGQQQSIASTTNNAWLTLEQSTRTSPYTIYGRTEPDGTFIYFLQDDESIAAYGLSERYMSISFVMPFDGSAAERIAASNQLYDLAVTALQKAKDEITTYSCKIVGLKHRFDGTETFKIGQTVRVIYRQTFEGPYGPVVTSEVDVDLYVMAYSRTIAQDSSEWDFTLTTIARQEQSDNKVLADFVSRMRGQQVVPMPFIIFGDARFAPDGLRLNSMSDLAAGETPRSIGFTDSTFENLHSEIYGARNAGLSTNYLVSQAYADADAYHISGIRLANDSDFDHAQWIAQSDGGDPLIWSIREASTPLAALQEDGGQYYLYRWNGTTLVKVGGTMQASGTGEFLIPAGPGAGNAVRSGSADAYGSWAGLATADATAPAAPTTTAFASVSTTHNVSMPGTVTADDLLVVLFSPRTSGSITTPSGWTSLGNITGTNARVASYYKVASGSEDGTTVDFVTGTACVGTAHCYRFITGQYSGVPEISTGATGGPSNPDPDAITPVTGRFIALAVESHDTDFTTTAAPSGYSGLTCTLSGAGGGGITIASGYKLCNSNTENPGQFTAAGAVWAAATVAVYGPQALAEAAYLTGLSAEPSGTPTYVQVQLATGAAGAESIIGTYSLTPEDPTIDFNAVVPVAASARLSARIATSASAANHGVKVRLINQDDVG